MALVHEHAARLREAGVPSPEVDALALVAHASGLPPADLRVADGSDVGAEARERLADLVARRAAREPLQHILGEVGFRRVVVACRPGVFVPRPETEVLAGLAIDRALAVGRPPVVVEPCTGTGVVALSVAVEVPSASVVAADASADAVALARENLRRVTAHPGLAPGAQVDVLLGDLLAPASGLRADVVVANPPYLTPEEVDASPSEVRDHDPHDALVAPGGGMEVLRRLLRDAHGVLRAGGSIVLETSEARVGMLADDAAAVGYVDVEIAADLAGRDRFVTARRPGGDRT